MLIINNNKNIIKTDFWATAWLNQKFYLSFNAGACRILLPTNREGDIRDMKTAREIVLSLGPSDLWAGGSLMYEVLFDDGTISPYSLHTTLAAADRTLSPEDHGKRIELSVWLPKPGSGLMGARCAFRRKAYVRIADQIPCLKPWAG